MLNKQQISSKLTFLNCSDSDTHNIRSFVGMGKLIINLINSLLIVICFFIFGLEPVKKFMKTSSNGDVFRVTGYLCGEITGKFPAQRPVTQSFGVFFDLRLNK